MTNQDNQNQIKANTAAPRTYKKSKLAFVGCENCSVNCCDGTRFNRASVLLNDLSHLAKFFPVVFTPTNKGQKIGMELIFSFKKGIPCLYQDSGTKKCTIWNIGRPRVCKSYPFLRAIKTADDSKRHFSLSIDFRYCEGVQESAEGIKIFNDDNEISEEIIDRFFGREVLADYEKNFLATNKFLGMVKELDLLVGAVITPGKKPLSAEGFKDDGFPMLMISQQKLAALDADSLKRLQAAGYINPINIHLKSLSNFQKLIQAMNAFEKSTQSNN